MSLSLRSIYSHKTFRIRSHEILKFRSNHPNPAKSYAGLMPIFFYPFVLCYYQISTNSSQRMFTRKLNSYIYDETHSPLRFRLWQWEGFSVVGFGYARSQLRVALVCRKRFKMAKLRLCMAKKVLSRCQLDIELEVRSMFVIINM
jgi:hypothetical protein